MRLPIPAPGYPRQSGMGWVVCAPLHTHHFRQALMAKVAVGELHVLNQVLWNTRKISDAVEAAEL